MKAPFAEGGRITPPSANSLLSHDHLESSLLLAGVKKDEVGARGIWAKAQPMRACRLTAGVKHSDQSAGCIKHCRLHKSRGVQLILNQNFTRAVDEPCMDRRGLSRTGLGAVAAIVHRNGLSVEVVPGNSACILADGQVQIVTSGLYRIGQ